MLTVTHRGGCQVAATPMEGNPLASRHAVAWASLASLMSSSPRWTGTVGSAPAIQAVKH